MKNLLSPAKATKVINDYGLVTVVAFKSTGQRSNTYSGLNVLHVFDHILRQMHAGRKVVIIEKEVFDTIPLSIKERDQTDPEAYDNYRGYQMDSKRLFL